MHFSACFFLRISSHSSVRGVPLVLPCRQCLKLPSGAPVSGEKAAHPRGPRPTDDRLFPPERPGGDCFSIFFLLFPDMPASTIFFFLPEKKGCPSIFSCVLSTVPSPSARMEPVRKACRSSLSEHPPAPGSPLHPAPEGTAVFLAAARRGTLRFRFRAAARG